MKKKINYFILFTLLYAGFGCQSNQPEAPAGTTSSQLTGADNAPEKKKILVCNILDIDDIGKAVGGTPEALSTSSSYDGNNSVCTFSWKISDLNVSGFKLSIAYKPEEEKSALWAENYFKKLLLDGLTVGGATYRFREVNIDNTNPAIWSDNQKRMLCRLGNDYIIGVNFIQPSPYGTAEAKQIVLTTIKKHFSSRD